MSLTRRLVVQRTRPRGKSLGTLEITLRCSTFFCCLAWASLLAGQDTVAPHIDNCTCNKGAKPLPELRFTTLPENGSAKADVCSLAPESRKEKWVAYGVRNRLQRPISVTWKDALLFFGHFHGDQLADYSGAGNLRSAEEVNDDKSTVLIETSSHTLSSAWVIKEKAHDDSSETWLCDKSDHRATVMALRASTNDATLAIAPLATTNVGTRYSLMLAPGENMAVSTSLDTWLDNLKLPRGWTREDSVSLKTLGIAQPWSYRRTAITGAIGITAGAVAQASGGPKWSTATGAAVGLLFDLNVQVIRRMRERGVLRRWLGPTEGGKYAVLRNGSGQDEIALAPAEKSVQATGKVLLFERGSSVFVGTELTVP